MQSVDYKLYSPKDVKLLKDNPVASPYELLKLGLSKKGYDRLMNESNKTSSKEESKKEIQSAINSVISSSVTNEKATDTNKDGVIKPTSVIEVAPISDKNATANNTPINPNGSVNVQNIVTGKIMTTSLYFANILIKDGKHKIV